MLHPWSSAPSDVETLSAAPGTEMEVAIKHTKVRYFGHDRLLCVHKEASSKFRVSDSAQTYAQLVVKNLIPFCHFDTQQ